LSVSLDVHAAQIPPVPENPLQAQTTLGFNPKTRCPDLRISDSGPIAVVVFWLPRSGIASHISIKSSSGSNALDAATISCVSKLRFAAATTLGDGDPIDSWQQIAFGWASGTSEPISAAPREKTANAKHDDSGGNANNVTVHVCVDESGKLEQSPTIVHSSGIASIDQAAVRIAASGSAYYRPDTSPNGRPASGCAQLAITFDMK
jgi:outer membrane biosynthesis protein TonB